jgi:hypothetical protein
MLGPYTRKMDTYTFRMTAYTRIMASHTLGMGCYTRMLGPYIPKMGHYTLRMTAYTRIMASPTLGMAAPTRIMASHTLGMAAPTLGMEPSAARVAGGRVKPRVQRFAEPWVNGPPEDPSSRGERQRPIDSVVNSFARLAGSNPFALRSPGWSASRNPGLTVHQKIRAREASDSGASIQLSILSPAWRAQILLLCVPRGGALRGTLG